MGQRTAGLGQSWFGLAFLMEPAVEKRMKVLKCNIITNISTAHCCFEESEVNCDIFQKLTLGLEASCMTAEPGNSSVLVLSGRVCSEVLGVEPTRIKRIKMIIE